MSWIVCEVTRSKVSRAHLDVCTQWGWEAREPRTPTPHGQVGAPTAPAMGHDPSRRAAREHCATSGGLTGALGNKKMCPP